MSDYKIQWNISLPPVAQYAKGHMLNIAAESLEELNEYLDELASSDTLEKAADVAAKLTALSGVVEKLGGSVESNEYHAPASSSDQGASVTQLRTCAHGKRIKREGQNSRGPWVGWYCPLPKGNPDQCKADFE